MPEGVAPQVAAVPGRVLVLSRFSVSQVKAIGWLARVQRDVMLPSAS